MKRVGGEAMAVWSSCSQVKNGCVEWVEKYFKDCVCNLSSEISFGFGLVSLFCWAIAEIPQIISNYHTKSGHGVSLALLLTWVIGDVFNLVGCLLEPVTLPTQFYTALLYTLTTVVLLVQTIYYDYFLRWWKYRGFADNSENEEEKRVPLNPKSQVDSSEPVAAIPSARSSPRMDIYYTSARSLASSPTPPYGSSSYLVAPRSGPSATLGHDSSSDEETTLPAHRARSKTKRNFSRSVGYGTVLATSANLPFQAQSLMVKHLVFSGTTLLQETGLQEIESNSFGLLLGWIMAAIYMGGRLPQIYLNIKRGSVEGLSPLMFLFALIANASYVGSILVRSMEWERIKANAPWLLDAIVCVLLDLFIIIQFGYYKVICRRSTCSKAAPTLA
ncbi:seven transmembrane protein 1-like [Dioscorea cayenensis subsp. rotundata]|uniref:Seven transmembrane protein 1-like n=1 Tax=Dioscorea cayennensis subsp. rotundata TaxID=55577 RepID=A0AB40CEW4_DIOCR|nr:seven transmembrane protein 1-like [Dioscorea cayenensis subsp. rotundata]